MFLVGVLVVFTSLTFTHGGAVCEDILVVLPDDNVLLRYFDHFDIIGRYRRVADQNLWTQLHGRHRITIGTAPNKTVTQELSFLAISSNSSSPLPIGLTAEFSAFFDPTVDSDFTYRLHDQLFSWTMYNYTFKQYITTYTFQFDELFIYCMDEQLSKSVSVCTGDRILDVTLYVDEPSGTRQILNDPETDVLRSSPGMYSEGRQQYMQDRSFFSISYLDVRLSSYHVHSWFVYYHTANTSEPVYFGNNINEAAPTPELTFDPWVRTGSSGTQVNNLVKCAAKLPDCSFCNSSNTDICLEGTNSSTFYCVCKQGYQGETCDELSPFCSQPPSELFGWVPDYYQGGPFYSGEIITVSCNADYPSLLSRWKYTSTCTDNRTWTSIETCLDWSLLPSAISRSDYGEVISALIKEVTSRISDQSPNPSRFTVLASQEWLIAVTMSIWVILPFCSTSIGWLLNKRRRQAEEQEKHSIWSMLSMHSYIWLWIYILWEILSLSIGFSQAFTDVFFYIDITTAALFLFMYIFHIIATFLSPEMALLGKKYPILTDEYFDSMKHHNRPELSVMAEIYHDEEITRNIQKTVDNGMLCSETVTLIQPVVTKCYREVFNYDQCLDITDGLQLEPHTIVEVRLHLEVSFQDEATRNEFSAMKSHLEYISKDDEGKVNTFQVVSLTTSDHQLRKGLDVSVCGVAGSSKFYTNVWFFRVLTFFLCGLPIQIFLRCCVLRPVRDYVVRKVISGVKEQPVRLRILDDTFPLSATRTSSALSQ
ncbi:uncharacterized protein [Watersipora subatra]|uniref:uncharacterized protein isoform X2 n=1 Tax=Watersipora subatra TaxID=2589382 RepID=UPI00355AFBE5